MKSKLIYHYFTDDDFLRITNKIQEMEKITAGEIRISLKDEKPFLKRKKNIRELAEEDFFNLNMNNTRDKTGILIYIILKERQFYILADSGIDEKVTQSTWEKVRDEMQEEFKNGHYTGGIIQAIERVGKILGEYFPIKPDDTNELSNKIVI